MSGYTFLCFTFVIIFNIFITNGQTPPRLNIPGAVLISRPPQRIQQRIPQPFLDPSQPPPTRLRKPILNAFPAAIPIREETEEPSGHLGIDEEDFPKSNFQPGFPLSRAENDNEEEPLPKPIQFRPERPLPILRQDLPTPPPRVILRQNIDDDSIPVRQPLPQTRRVPPQPIRQTIKPQQRQPPPENIPTDDNRRNKNRKPPVQILRKYRTDNEDGSITWGYENEDGSFKEETIGTDCIIRGKYGYIDPEGTKREYNYEAGNKCDKTEEELPPEEALSQPNIPNRPPVYLKKPVYKVPLQN